MTFWQRSIGRMSVKWVFAGVFRGFQPGNGKRAKVIGGMSRRLVGTPDESLGKDFIRSANQLVLVWGAFIDCEKFILININYPSQEVHSTIRRIPRLKMEDDILTRRENAGFLALLIKELKGKDQRLSGLGFVFFATRQAPEQGGEREAEKERIFH